MSAGTAVTKMADTHGTLCIVAAIVAALLCVWRWRARSGMSAKGRAAYLVVMCVMLGVLAAGAHLGGRMVYEYGAGASLAGPSHSD